MTAWRASIRHRRLTCLALAGIYFSVSAPSLATPTEKASASAGAPADGILGYVVDEFFMPIVPGMTACPHGLSPTLREAYLEAQPPAERERLLRKENEPELTRLWKAQAVGPNGTNICSQPDMFNRPLMKTVENKIAWGMNLDKGDPDTCKHEKFVSPTGEKNIDNQEYRALGCRANVRGKDGSGSEAQTGFKQFIASGEWTQVLLLRGVHNLQNQANVEVIYGNTPDRPPQDTKGHFLRGASFTISDMPPRNRNVLRGQIVNGVLTTEPATIILTQTWGQGGARDIRGNRTKFTFYKGRLRLNLLPDGSLHGLVAGYRPVFEDIQSPSIGGIGSATVAGIDCASQLATLKALADGIRDKKSGQCTAVSGTMEINAIPAFVNDVPNASEGTAR